jgi:hypothetical protein
VRHRQISQRHLCRNWLRRNRLARRKRISQRHSRCNWFHRNRPACCKRISQRHCRRNPPRISNLSRRPLPRRRRWQCPRRCPRLCWTHRSERSRFHRQSGNPSPEPRGSPRPPIANGPRGWDHRHRSRRPSCLRSRACLSPHRPPIPEHRRSLRRLPGCAWRPSTMCPPSPGNPRTPQRRISPSPAQPNPNLSRRMVRHQPPAKPSAPQPSLRFHSYHYRSQRNHRRHCYRQAPGRPQPHPTRRRRPPRRPGRRLPPPPSRWLLLLFPWPTPRMARSGLP